VINRSRIINCLKILKISFFFVKILAFSLTKSHCKPKLACFQCEKTGKFFWEKNSGLNQFIAHTMAAENKMKIFVS